MFLVAPVIIHHPELAALGIAPFWRFVLVVMFYLIPDVEQQSVYLLALRLHCLKRLLSLLHTCTMLLVHLTEYLIMSRNHAYRRIVNRTSALLQARFLALYFEASMNGEQMPDIDGEQFYEVTDDEDEE